MAAPLDVEVEEEEPLWAPPVAVDSLALRLAASPENTVATTLVLLLHCEGTEYLTEEENWTSAHYGN